MNVALTPELEQLVEDKIASGQYSSATEVIGVALRLLDKQEQRRQERLEELRREVLLGVEALDRGEVVPAEEVFRELRQQQEEMEDRTQ